jgi:hypothetical protein
MQYLLVTKGTTAVLLYNYLNFTKVCKLNSFYRLSFPVTSLFLKFYFYIRFYSVSNDTTQSVNINFYVFTLKLRYGEMNFVRVAGIEK